MASVSCKAKKTGSEVYYKLKKSYTSSGTYSLSISTSDTYYIEMYGAGGGNAANWHRYNGSYWAYYTAGGGSGAGFKGFVNLSAGTYSVTVGAHGGNGAQAGSGGTSQGSAGTATVLGSIISAGGGTGAYISGGDYKVSRVGVGGTLSILDSSKIISTRLSSNGNDGDTKAATGYVYPPSTATYYPQVWGGMSLYDGSETGYGAGGGYKATSSAYVSVNGALIIYGRGTSSDYDFVVGTTNIFSFYKSSKYYSAR